MAKIQKISHIEPVLGFTEFDILKSTVKALSVVSWVVFTLSSLLLRLRISWV